MPLKMVLSNSERERENTKYQSEGFDPVNEPNSATFFVRIRNALHWCMIIDLVYASPVISSKNNVTFISGARIHILYTHRTCITHGSLCACCNVRCCVCVCVCIEVGVGHDFNQYRFLYPCNRLFLFSAMKRNIEFAFLTSFTRLCTMYRCTRL